MFHIGDRVRVARLILEHCPADGNLAAQQVEARDKAHALTPFLGLEGMVTYVYCDPAAGYYTVGFGPSQPFESICDFMEEELELEEAQ